jgi:hypothetical protein
MSPSLGRQGFGVLTTIDVQAMKKKLDIDFRPTSFWARAIQFAYKALKRRQNRNHAAVQRRRAGSRQGRG